MPIRYRRVRSLPVADAGVYSSVLGIRESDGGTLELSSPDAFIHWQIRTAIHDVETLHYYWTGPASKEAVLIPPGTSATIDAHCLEELYTDLTVECRRNGVPLYDWSAGAPPVATADAASVPNPRAIVRFLEGVSPADVVSQHDREVWRSHSVGAFAIAAKVGSPADFWYSMANKADFAAIKAGGAAQLLGFVPGYCNRMAVMASGNLELVVSTLQLNLAAAVAVYTSPVGAPYHELAVSPIDIVYAINNTAADLLVQANFWRV